MAGYIFREIKLLRYLKHENVCAAGINPFTRLILTEQFANLVDITVSPSADMYVFSYRHTRLPPRSLILNNAHTEQCRYITTEWMETDLQTLLRMRPIQDEFVQYFLYQIMVRLTINTNNHVLTSCLAWT